MFLGHNKSIGYDFWQQRKQNLPFINICFAQHFEEIYIIYTAFFSISKYENITDKF
jgi:hypothetical protein